MKYYLILLLATLLLGGCFITQKSYSKKTCGTTEQSLFFVMMSSIIEVFFFFSFNGFKLHLTPFTIGLATLNGVILVTCLILSFKIYKITSVAVYSFFLLTGGMILPYIMGLLFLNEQFSILRTLGLLLILISLAITNLDLKAVNKPAIVLCIIVFILNGFVSIVSKLHQISPMASGTNDFIILLALVRALVSAILLIGLKKKKENFKITVLPVIPVIICFALCDGMSSFLQLLGATEVPATVLYPMVTGGGIIFTAILAFVFFKEKPTKKVLASIALCFVGTLLFL